MSISPIVAATADLTASGVFTDTQTVVVGGKTYTTQTVLTNVDGNVAIGASAAVTLQNLFNAINLGGVPGTDYALAMTRNAQVVATKVTATVLTVKAAVGGTIGNLVATSETQTNAAWTGANLAGGTGSTGQAVQEILASNQLNASAYQDIVDLSATGATA